MHPDPTMSIEEIINQASKLLGNIDNTLKKFLELNTSSESANKRDIFGAAAPNISEKRTKLEANLVLLKEADRELHQAIQERQENLSKPVSPTKHSL